MFYHRRVDGFDGSAGSYIRIWDIGTGTLMQSNVASRWDSTNADGYGYTVVADMNNDGTPDVVTKYGAYRANGTVIYNTTIGFDNPVVTDIDGDLTLDILYSTYPNTRIFYSNSSNALPVITSVTVDPSTTVSVNETVTFTIASTDAESNTRKSAVNCGDGTGLTSFITGSVQSCTYAVDGTFEVELRLSDYSHGDNQYDSQNVTMTVSLLPTGSTIGGGILGGVTFQSQLVDPDNIDEGLLPNIYVGIVSFFSSIFVPLMIVIIAIMILLFGLLLIKKAKGF